MRVKGETVNLIKNDKDEEDEVKEVTQDMLSNKLTASIWFGYCLQVLLKLSGNTAVFELCLPGMCKRNVLTAVIGCRAVHRG